MKRKIVLFLCILTILSGFVIYGTYANYVASSKATNVITTSEVQIELIEKTCTANGIIEDFDNEIIHKVYPGDSFSKIPYVENTGTENCYVRIHIDTEFDQYITFDINENWIKEETESDTANGWYRYNRVLEVGETTEPIFTTVTFSVGMGNEFLDEEITVSLMADAVQSEYNDEFLNDMKESEGQK